MKRPRTKHFLSFLYILIFAALAFLFFTNDFGILDLRKTSVVIGVAIDVEEDDVVLTAQLAVPQPAENGENTQFNVVTGTGATVAAALNEVNVKTGFYPKLVFCKLILLGESCFAEDITKLLDYFYRNEYTGLTLNVAACQGKASEVLGQQFPCGNSATDVIDKLLSAEAKASGNVSAATIKELGEGLYSPSASAYMPYLENGIVEKGEDESGGGESGGGGGGSGGQSSQCEESELVCNRCAIFSNGYCQGVLSKEQTFVFNLIKNDVKHAFLKAGEGEDTCVLGLRSCKGDVGLKFEQGTPVLNFKFTATAKVQDSQDGFHPQNIESGGVNDDDLKLGQDQVTAMFNSLFESVKTLGCDVLNLKNMMYKSNYDKYDQFSENLYECLTVTSEVKLKSAE